LITVDAYCHVGDCCIYDTSVTETEIVDALNANRLSAVILQPFPGAPNPVEAHDRIAELGSKHPGRIFGVASASPHVDRDRYHREIERCVRELGFVGVALETFGHVVNPNGRDAKTVFEVARELTIPVVVETGWGAPFGLPSAVLPRAREYSDVKIVLAHAGAGLYTFEAYVVARECSNVYLETSWCRGVDVKWLVDELGASRVMFGSDLASNQEAELAKYRSLGLYHFQQYQAMGQTAIDIFGLKGVSEYVEPTQEAALRVEPPVESTEMSATDSESPTDEPTDSRQAAETGEAVPAESAQ
jgi:predicted TIM-barrel fold metal-dependent hydrolase